MPVRRLALVLGVWTIPGVMYTLETAYAWSLAGTPAPLWRAAAYQIPSWWVWALATYPIVAIVRSFPLVRRGWVRSIAVHAGVCFVIVCGYSLAKSLLAVWTPTGAHSELGEAFVHQVGQWWPANVLTYCAVVGVITAIFHARTAQQRELRTAQLTAELSRTQLQALRAQIHPHFVFNALHTVAAIVRARDPDKAVTVLASLADILRDTFRGDPDREVVLREELAWIARYLSIQQARFDDRVEIVWRIGEGTLDALVPQMVLQPLVENAFRHGMARRGAAGRVELTAERVDAVLTLSVRDDGPELSAAPASESQTGLASTRARLTLLYADAAKLSLCRDADATIATVTLPFHLASAA
jgi:two-component system, LytTR family, sensor kinase